MNTQKLTSLVKSLLQNEIIKYLVSGGITTVFYVAVRFSVFAILPISIVATVIANGLAILLAFFLNDTWVFQEGKQGRFKRLQAFFVARLSTMALDAGLSLIFVQLYPNLIGQFVGNNLQLVDLIVSITGQILIIILNYVISKVFIYKK